MSASVTLPSGPSKTYSFSISTIGRSRRSALSASRARVSSFSFFSSSRRAERQSSRVAIRGRLMRVRPPRALELIGQERHLHPCVLSHERRSRHCLGAESLVEVVERGV